MGFTVSCFWNMVLEFISCSGFRVSGWWFNLDLARDLKQLIPLFLLLLRLPLLPRPQLRTRGESSGVCVARGVGVYIWLEETWVAHQQEVPWPVGRGRVGLLYLALKTFIPFECWGNYERFSPVHRARLFRSQRSRGMCVSGQRQIATAFIRNQRFALF